MLTKGCGVENIWSLANTLNLEGAKDITFENRDANMRLQSCLVFGLILPETLFLYVYMIILEMLKQFEKHLEIAQCTTVFLCWPLNLSSSESGGYIFHHWSLSGPHKLLCL